TSPTAMTTWKARMLDELYFATDAYLAGHVDRDEERRVEAIRAAALERWRGPPEPLRAFLAGMPDRYLLANDPGAIAAHARIALGRGRRDVQVGLVPTSSPGAAELCVVARDKPGLLASIAAAMTAGRLEVLAAQVYSRNDEAVDLFWVRDRADGAEGVP